MRIVNAMPGGSTVFITDMKLRVGDESVVARRSEARESNDLNNALERGIVYLELTEADTRDGYIADLISTAEAAAKRREGSVLFAQVERYMRSGLPVPAAVPIRRAVFELVEGAV